MTTATFDVPSELTIDLRATSGEVVIERGPSGKAHVELIATSQVGDTVIEDSRIELIESRLIVHVPERAHSRGFFRTRLGGSISIRLTVPDHASLDAELTSADLRAHVDLRAASVRSASGDISLTDVRGPVSLTTASGDVSIGDVGDDLNVTTASGDIRAGDVARATSVRSASGNVSLGRLAGDVRARSVSGDVKVGELAGGSCNLASTSGDLHLQVAHGLEIHLDVASVSGELTSDLAEGGGTGRSDVDLSVRARTVSGDVVITRAARPSRSSGGGTILGTIL